MKELTSLLVFAVVIWIVTQCFSLKMGIALFDDLNNGSIGEGTSVTVGPH